MLSARVVWMRGVAPLLTPLLSSSSHLTCFVHGKDKLFCSETSKEQDHSSFVDVEVQVDKVVNYLCLRTMTQYSRKQVASLYQLLLDMGIKGETIEAQLLETPDLLGFSHKAWTNICEVMVDNGMPSLLILQSIALQPRLLKLKQSFLHERLLHYRQMRVGKMNILTLVMKHPVLLFTEPSQVRGRLESLTALFPPTTLKSLVQNNPNVLTDGWEDIMAKIMYIHKEMGLEQPHIASTMCLTHSLLHIKTRHLFLFRAGIYKTPNLLRDKQSPSRNHSLRNIMDTSDKHFANRIAQLTVLEYNAFKVMMAAEEQGIDDFYDSDDSDEEDPKLSYKKHR